MKRPRRTFLQLAAGATALPALSRIARAQAYPTRPAARRVRCGHEKNLPSMHSRSSDVLVHRRFGSPVGLRWKN